MKQVPFKDFSYTVDMINYSKGKRDLLGGDKAQYDPYIKGMKELEQDNLKKRKEDNHVDAKK